ncbi:unnamed protein product, partial [Effrenium voratum]
MADIQASHSPSPEHRGTVDESLWEADPEELGQYRLLYDCLDQSDLPTAEAEVLQRSGLSSNELAQIWQLSDVDFDGQLALCEFACAMILTSRRRGGAPLPEELPAPLARLVAGAVELPMEDESKWAITPEELERYRQVFDSERTGPSFSKVEAREVLKRSNLPLQDLQQILRLSDVDEDERLYFGEFACALHLAALRREAEPLPPQLPGPLREIAQDGRLAGAEPELELFAELFQQLRRPGQECLGPAEVNE